MSGYLAACTSLPGRCLGVAQVSLSPQMLQELLFFHSTGLYEQRAVYGLGRGQAHICIIGIFNSEADLKFAQFQAQFTRHHRP